MHLIPNHVSHFIIFIHKARFCVSGGSNAIKSNSNGEKNGWLKWFAWEVSIRWCLIDVMNFFLSNSAFWSLWIIISISLRSLYLKRVADGLLFFLNKHRSALEISHVIRFFCFRTVSEWCAEFHTHSSCRWTGQIRTMLYSVCPIPLSKQASRSKMIFG